MVSPQGPTAAALTCTFKCAAMLTTTVKVQALQVQIFTQVTELSHSSGLKLDVSFHVLDFCHCFVDVLLCHAVRNLAAVASPAWQKPGHCCYGRTQSTLRSCSSWCLFPGEPWPCEPPTRPSGKSTTADSKDRFSSLAWQSLTKHFKE